MKTKYSLIALLLGISSYGFAQNVNRFIKQRDVERVIKTLTGDDMQGRATFTPGIEKAAQFIEGEFKDIGLVPLKGNTGFRQNFSMIKGTPVKAQVMLDGKIIGAENIAVMAGTSFNWSNNADVQIARIGAEQNIQQEVRKYLMGTGKTLLLVDPHFEAYFKRIQPRLNRGSVEFSDAVSARQLVVVLGSYDNVKSFEVSYQTKSEQLPLFNIAGILPGKSKPDEYVVFSGHYDHLGIITPMQGDSIANGADDDASGTTAVITLAKYFKKLNNNARTLVFVAFTAEEIGEFGSQYFAKNFDADKTVAMFNIEMIGKPSKFSVNSAFITGFDRSDFGAILQRNLQGTAFKFYPDPYPEQDLFYRSDNASLAKVGVPAHTISTDQIDVDKYYHTVKDELSTLNLNNITATIRAIALSSRGIVSGKDTPKRVPKFQ